MNTVGAVIITSEEYRSLISDSCKLNEIANYMAREKYATASDVRRILGVEEPQINEEPKGVEE